MHCGIIVRLGVLVCVEEHLIIAGKYSFFSCFFLKFYIDFSY